MEFRFDMILYSKLGNGTFDEGCIKCSSGPHLVYGPQVPHLWYSGCKPIHNANHLHYYNGVRTSFAQQFSCNNHPYCNHYQYVKNTTHVLKQLLHRKKLAKEQFTAFAIFHFEIYCLLFLFFVCIWCFACVATCVLFSLPVACH